LVEPLHPGPGEEALTATVLEDDRLLLDLGGSPRPTTMVDVVATFFTPDTLFRVTGVLEPAMSERGLFELIVKDVERVQRRKSARLLVDVAASLVVVDAPGPVVSVRGRTRNVSAGGCRVVTEQALPPTGAPIVTLELDDECGPLIAQATILQREHHDSVWDYRLMFTGIDAGDRVRLELLGAA
jgi:hypothetical protein